jgi:hypothetical protein
MRILKAPGHKTKNAALRRVLEIKMPIFRYPFGLNRNFVRPRLALALALRRLF